MPGKVKSAPAKAKGPSAKAADDQPLYMQLGDVEEDITDNDEGSDSDDMDEDVNDGEDVQAGKAQADAKAGPKQWSHESKQSLYRLPTGDEMRQLKETEQLFKSNLFRLQVCAVSLNECDVPQCVRAVRRPVNTSMLGA